MHRKKDYRLKIVCDTYIETTRAVDSQRSSYETDKSCAQNGAACQQKHDQEGCLPQLQKDQFSFRNDQVMYYFRSVKTNRLMVTSPIYLGMITFLVHSNRLQN